MTPTREQLELAAKAAGLTLKDCTCKKELKCVETNKHWNPTTSKSDSFDLMVALMARDFEIISNDKEVCVHCFYECRGSALLEDYNNDKGLATMWAVFLCAVEIGRSL
jgi:hypothetical protein